MLEKTVQVFLKRVKSRKHCHPKSDCLISLNENFTKLSLVIKDYNNGQEAVIFRFFVARDSQSLLKRR